MRGPAIKLRRTRNAEGHLDDVWGDRVGDLSVADNEEEMMIQKFAPVIRVTTDDEARLIVTVAGEIDLFSAWLIDATLCDANDDREVHIDCADVNFMDSTGLSALLRHSQRLRRGGGSLSLLRPSGAVRHVVGIAGLNDILITAGEQ